ncbi:hypothetical protein [Streptomyces sp. NPDC090112]|uniref:hypothetical protein n=1 Tax=Streptomyces sp. NPDC090112 TaxID=3365949 RepID=UPI00380E2CF5
MRGDQLQHPRVTVPALGDLHGAAGIHDPFKCGTSRSMASSTRPAPASSSANARQALVRPDAAGRVGADRIQGLQHLQGPAELSRPAELLRRTPRAEPVAAFRRGPNRLLRPGEAESRA